MQRSKSTLVATLALGPLVWSLVALFLFQSWDVPHRAWAFGAAYLPQIASKPWQFFTASWLHLDLIHLAGNLLGLLSLGAICARYRSAAQACFLAAFGMISGSIVGVYARPEDHLLGASGGVFALIAADVFLAIKNRNLSFLLLFWILSAIFISFHSEPAHTAHFIGALAGLTFAWKPIQPKWALAGFLFISALQTVAAGRCLWDLRATSQKITLRSGKQITLQGHFESRSNPLLGGDYWTDGLLHLWIQDSAQRSEITPIFSILDCEPAFITAHQIRCKPKTGTGIAGIQLRPQECFIWVSASESAFSKAF